MKVRGKTISLIFCVITMFDYPRFQTVHLVKQTKCTCGIHILGPTVFHYTYMFQLTIMP